MVGADIPSMTLAELILRQCVLPRCRLSELDATYCGQFVRLLHRINAPNFPTLNVIWTLFNNLSPVLTSLTEAEVNNIGVVACDMLAMVNQWHGDRALVERMVGGGCVPTHASVFVCADRHEAQRLAWLPDGHNVREIGKHVLSNSFLPCQGEPLSGLDGFNALFLCCRCW
jgi:hypothetical protein